MQHARKIGLLGTSLAVAIISNATVMALPAQANAHAENSSTTTEQHDGSESQTNAHLADAKLKACQNRQNAINKIQAHIVTRGTKQLNLFDTIAQRVETFKTTKNLSVDNYDQLVATIQADKTKATNDLAAMKTNDTIDCSSSDPKGMVSTFQTDLKTEISDLKTYKTDVKNLIVAVKTAAGSSTSSSGDNSSTSTGGDQ